MHEGGVLRLQASHTQSGQRTICFACFDPVVGFNVRNHIFDQTLFEFHIGHPDASLGWIGQYRAIGKSSGLVGVTIGHHHDHRFGFAGIDQVIHNGWGYTQRGPGIFVPSPAVQQVEYRITFF